MTARFLSLAIAAAGIACAGMTTTNSTHAIASLPADTIEARRLFEEGVTTLARNLHRWDTGQWSRYDLFPHPVPNVASPAYHGGVSGLARMAPR